MPTPENDEKVTVKVRNKETKPTEKTTVEAKVDNIQVIVPGEAPPRTGRGLTRFFNTTAGMEKGIQAVLVALSVYVGQSQWFLGDDGKITAEGVLVIGLIGAVQIIYTQSTTVVPVSNSAPPK